MRWWIPSNQIHRADYWAAHHYLLIEQYALHITVLIGDQKVEQRNAAGSQNQPKGLQKHFCVILQLYEYDQLAATSHPALISSLMQMANFRWTLLGLMQVLAHYKLIVTCEWWSHPSSMVGLIMLCINLGV